MLARNEIAQEIRDLAAKLASSDHAVDESMFEQELGALEARRQCRVALRLLIKVVSLL